MKRNIVIVTVALGILSLTVWRGCKTTPEPAEPPTSSKSSGRPSRDLDPKPIKEPTTKEEYEAIVKEKSIAFAQRNNAPIAFYGRVVDQDGRPLQGVTVGFRVTAIPMIPVPWGPDETSKGSRVTDQNGLFSVEGMRGVSLGVGSFEKSGYRESGFYRQGHVRYEPHSPERHIPNRDTPVEFMLIRDDQSRAEVAYDKILDFTWNAGPVTLNCGKMVGTIILTPVRNGMNSSNKMQAFEWSVEVRTEGFEIVLLPDSAIRVAPAAGYQPQSHLGFPLDSKKWRARESCSYAIKTSGGNYGIMKLQLAGDGEDGYMSGSVTIYLNKSGARNIDHK